MSDLEIRQRDRRALRAGYSRAVRNFEIASIAGFAVVMAWLLVTIAPRIAGNPFLAMAAFMVGFIAADFGSGFVHWMADTWGTTEWPIIGKALIRPFREHHVDEKEITRHDFIETNGNNCFISSPVAAIAALLPDGSVCFFLAAMTFAMCLAIFGTNQFHKWAHMDAPPRYARVLQLANLILPPEHHAVHHTAPFAKYYCITVLPDPGEDRHVHQRLDPAGRRHWQARRVGRSAATSAPVAGAAEDRAALDRPAARSAGGCRPIDGGGLERVS